MRTPDRNARSAARAAAAVLALLVPPGLASAQAPADPAALLPAPVVAAVGGSSGPAVLTGVRALLERVRPRLGPRLDLVLGLAEPFLRGALGAGPDELAELLAPGPFALAWIADGDRGFAVFVAARPAGAEPELARVLERLARGRPLASAVEDGVLVVAHSREQCARFTALRRAGRCARSLAAAGGSLAAVVDLAAVRRARLGDAPQKAPEELEPGQRFLLGALPRALAEGSALSATLRIDAGGVALEAVIDRGLAPGDPEQVLIAAGERGRALPALPAEAVATLALDRSPRQFFAGLESFAGPGAIAAARGGLSILDTLLAASFTDDLLPALGEPATLVLLREPEAAEPRPLVQLPAFALVVPLKEPRTARRLMTRAFHALAIIQRKERLEQGLVAFVHRVRRTAGGDVLQVVEPEEWRGPGAPPTVCGLSPALCVTERHAVLATTARAAELLAQALAGGGGGGGGGGGASGDSGTGDGEVVRGDRAELSLPAAAEYLRRNLEVAAFGKALDEGPQLAAARRELEDLASVLGAFARASLRVVPGESSTALALRVEVGDGH